MSNLKFTQIAKQSDNWFFLYFEPHHVLEITTLSYPTGLGIKQQDSPLGFRVSYFKSFPIKELSMDLVNSVYKLYI